MTYNWFADLESSISVFINVPPEVLDKKKLLGKGVATGGGWAGAPGPEARKWGAPK